MLLLAAALAAGSGCVPEDAPDDPRSIPIGLLLSYTGASAAGSINSERAVRLAIETINREGGVAGGRPLRLEVRDIQSDGTRALRMLADLTGGQQVAAVIGPDAPNVINTFVIDHRPLTLFLPGVAMSARDFIFGARNWFTFAPSTWALACAYQRRLEEMGVRRPLILFTSDSFHAELAVALKMTLGLPDRALAVPAQVTPGADAIEEIVARDKDSLILLAFPETAAALVSELSFQSRRLGGVTWFLSPTLNTPRFFANVLPGALLAARGPRPARPPDEGDFRAAFRQRWNDEPLDEAHAFFDAAALAALALERALRQDGALPDAQRLGAHVRPVAAPPGLPIGWNRLREALALVREGMDIDYQGISGALDFDELGDPASIGIQWWRMDAGGAVDDGRPLQVMAAPGTPCRLVQ